MDLSHEQARSYNGLKQSERMNYLAHLYLAGDDDAEISGALLGDFIKGPLHRIALPASVVEGIRLHRQIDSFTDEHPIVARSRERLSQRRLVSGIIIDVVYDHFLANHWQAFANQTIDEFAQQRYQRLLAHRASFPEQLQKMVTHMTQHDWLTSYAELETTAFAIERIGKRLSRPDLLNDVYQDLADNYRGLEEDFLTFFPQAIDNLARFHRKK